MKEDPVLPALDTMLTARLRAVAARARRYVLIEGIAWVVGFLLAAGVLQFFLDAAAHGMRWSMRAALLAAVVAGALWLMWRRALAPLRLRLGLADVAKLLERRYPDLSSMLISAVRFAGGEVGPPATNSRALCASVIRDAGRRAPSLDVAGVLDPRRAKRSGLVLASALTVVILLAAVSHEATLLWFRRNVLLREVPWPKQTHLVVDLDGPELIGALGDDLIVSAHAEGVQPKEVEFIFETTSGRRGRETMVTVGSEGAYRYRYTFKNAREGFVFRLEGGDDRTDPYRARLLERPRVTQTDMRIVPPAYTGRAALSLRDGERSAPVLPGSEVTIRIATNKPVTQATLMVGSRPVVHAVPEDSRWVAAFAPEETHTYSFALTDEAGLENRRPVRFSLRVVEDDPPRARMKLSGASDMITPQAILPIELEYTDTYGLAAAKLVYRLARDDTTTEGSIPLPTFKPRLTRFATSLAWPVASEGLTPGDILTLFAWAEDYNSVTGPGRARSPELTLRVVTRDELLAELARREQEYRLDFERLIDSQERLRSALLTVLGRAGDREAFPRLAAELTPLERRQRSITGSVNVLRQQFERILAELRVNQLDSMNERERLGNRIVTPLTALAKRDLVAAADAIRQWSRTGLTRQAAEIDPQQVAVLSQMRSVLANMIQWEGYQEVVNMLRDIIRLQQELRRETKSTVEEQGSDVFDD